jgi:putative ABC transport system permease protein
MNRFSLAVKFALKNITKNRGRTILSLLGVVLGVMVVIVVLSLGNGLREFLVGQIESFGSDIMQIEPKVPKVKKTSSQNSGGQIGGMQITTLKKDDAEAVAKITNVDSWYAGNITQQVASYKSYDDNLLMMGITAGVTEADPKTEIESGQFFTDKDDESLRQVVVLGSTAKEKMFPNEDPIGKEIKIKNQSFKVVGTLKPRGVTGFFNMDEMLFLPLQTMQKKITGTDNIQFAVFKLKDMTKLDLTLLEATDIMRREHSIKNPDDDDFAVNSIVEVKEILDKVFNVINLLLIGLTSISLLVGGVGIMNVMYVAVTERTFEIGLRKSIGAKQSDILRQFLLEAVFLTVAGGIIGIILGAGIAYVASLIIGKLGYFLNFSVSLQAILIGFTFSALTGIVFGLYPARKASQISPMEAMRHE